MEREDALKTIKESCSHISAELTRIHPAVGALGNPQIQDEMIKALFQLTKDVEMVKKLAKRVEG